MEAEVALKLAKNYTDTHSGAPTDEQVEGAIDSLVNKYPGKFTYDDTEIRCKIAQQSEEIETIKELYPIHKERDNGFDLTAMELLDSMGAGWNLGNTLDGHRQNTTIDESEINDKNIFYATWYKNIPPTRELINYIASLGFKSVRLPVTWYCHMTNGQIDTEWMDYVEMVVNWILDADMYCVLNIHHDGQTYLSYQRPKYAYLTKALNYTENVWKQICERFKDYNSKLIFEGYNEIGSTRIYEDADCVSHIAQKFINVVRKTGGNNDVRCLVVGTVYDTIGRESFGLFVMPTDTVANKLILNVHEYSKNMSDLKIEMTILNDMKNNKNIPIMINEYGFAKDQLDNYEEMYSYFYEKVQEYGLQAFIWDNGVSAYRIIDRMNMTAFYPSIVKMATGADVETKTWQYPFSVDGMNYRALVYNHDGNGKYGKYIAILSEYPIKKFGVFEKTSQFDLSEGYYNLSFDNYGKVSMYESNDGLTFTSLCNYLDNAHSPYNKKYPIFGSTTSMKLLSANYSIEGWNADSHEGMYNNGYWDIEWEQGDTIPTEINYGNVASIDSDGYLSFTEVNEGESGNIEILSDVTDNAILEVEISVPTTDRNSSALVLLRCNDKGGGSTAFYGGNIVQGNDTNLIIVNDYDSDKFYKIRQQINNGGIAKVVDGVTKFGMSLGNSVGNSIIKGYRVGDKCTKIRAIRYKKI